MTPNPNVDPKFHGIFSKDPVEAERAYRDLQKRLLRFFEWKGCAAADDLAQETLKRAFSRVAEGQTVYSENPASYFMGIARLVLLEWWKRRKEDQLDPEPQGPLFQSPNPENSMNQRILLQRLLDGLSEEDREFLIAYTFKDRAGLAESRGETMNAMRIRAYRIRETIRARLERPRARSAEKPEDKS